MPFYAGRLVFVNALTDDPVTAEVAARFSLDRAPASVCVTRDDAVMYTSVGIIDPAQLLARIELISGP